MLYRAKSIYSDDWFISEEIKFDFDLTYLKINNKWRECEKETLGKSFQNLKDKNNDFIFASMNENRNGGDIIRIYELNENEEYEDRIVFIKNNNIFVSSLIDKDIYCPIDLLDLKFVEKIKIFEIN